MARTVRIYDLSRPAQYQAMEAALAAARERLQREPQDPDALAVFGRWYALNGVDDWAVELLERARGKGVDVSPLLLARCYLRLDDTAAAAVEFKKAIDRHEAPREYLRLCAGLADNPEFATKRAIRYASAGNFRQAEVELDRGRQPGDNMWWHKEGCLLAYLQERDKYHELCREMLKLYSASTDPDIAERVLKTVLLWPPEDANARQELFRQLEPLEKLLESSDLTPWRLLARGTFAYRAGRYPQAIELFRRIAKEFSEDPEYARALAPTYELFLAMALHNSGGNDEQMKQAARSAMAGIARYRLGSHGDPIELWCVMQIALREARRVLDLPLETTSSLPPAATSPQAEKE
jgi:tetratricopeptide (TPR) repeat protein